MESREALLRQREHERNLLTQRHMVFLTMSSILFLSFVELREVELLNQVVSIVGIVSCFIAIPHFWGIKIMLDEIDTKLELLELKEKEAKVSRRGKRVRQIFRGRIIFIWIELLFCFIWGFSSWYSFCG